MTVLGILTMVNTQQVASGKLVLPPFWAVASQRVGTGSRHPNPVEAAPISVKQDPEVVGVGQ